MVQGGEGGRGEGRSEGWRARVRSVGNGFSGGCREERWRDRGKDGRREGGKEEGKKRRMEGEAKGKRG